LTILLHDNQNENLSLYSAYLHKRLPIGFAGLEYMRTTSINEEKGGFWTGEGNINRRYLRFVLPSDRFPGLHCKQQASVSHTKKGAFRKAPFFGILLQCTGA